MNWVRAIERLRRERRPGVLVTIVSVRGHAPRAAGAKMVVASDATWDTVGGGNLEATAVARAREILAGMGRHPGLGNTNAGNTARDTSEASDFNADGSNAGGPDPDATDPDAGPPAPETLTLSLSDKARTQHGQQCCGGEVTILLEPLAVIPAVAIFGVGHVGLELARILARHDIELHLVDSRAVQLDPTRLACLDDALAQVHVHHAPVPEFVLGQIPHGTHVLIMTHDHAEDAALCDMALRSTRTASIGLIGSSAKWRRFEKQLSAEGHSAAQLARITLPIGLPGITGKEPATIALSVAASLIESFPTRTSASPRPSRPASTADTSTSAPSTSAPSTSTSTPVNSTSTSATSTPATSTREASDTSSHRPAHDSSFGSSRRPSHDSSQRTSGGSTGTDPS